MTFRWYACLAAAAGLALLAGIAPAKADYTEQVDTADCSGSSAISRNTAVPLTGNFTCSGGASAKATSDITSGTVGAYATTGNLGVGTGEAEATLSAIITFLPHQIVPITATMRFKGVITGGQASGPSGHVFVFQAAVNNGFLNFGITGVDGADGVTTTANGESGVGSFLNATLSEDDTSLARGDVDITLSETSNINTGSSGQVLMSAFLYAQVDPAVSGVESTVDFLDPGTFTFSVPAGTEFTSDGFLEAAPALPSAVPEPAPFLVVAVGLLGLGLTGRRRAH